MMRGPFRWFSLLLLASAGCGSGGGSKPMGMDGGGNAGDGGQQPDLAADVPPVTDGPSDTIGGFEPLPLPYFCGTCGFGVAATPVPTDAGVLKFGLTVLATGLPRTVGLEVDATYAYLATPSAFLRMPLAGGTPEMMVAGAAPVATAIDADNLYWIDSSVTGQTTILRAPLTATGWAAFPGDAGAAQTATMLASQAGTPGPFTLSGGYVYFAVGSVTSRVPTAGGTVQTIATAFPPTGIAVGGDAAYLGEASGETIRRLPLSGTLPGTPVSIKLSYANPVALAFNATSGEIYWGDWFGGIEYFPVATPTAGNRFSTSCGIPCEERIRPGGRGAVWASEADSCGSIGKVDSTTGTTLMACALAGIGGFAATATHAYATTALGEFLRWDL